MLTDAEEAAVRELLTRTRQNQFVGTPLRGGLPLVPQLTALPTASIDNVGRIVYVPGASGVADAAWICEKAAAGTYSWVPLDTAAAAGLGAVDFLVGTATGLLSGEIVAGTSPGGELGGTWASPTVDATHSGSSHAMILRYSNTSEVTTVSTSAVDLLTSSAISIPVTSGLVINGVYRKTAGAASLAYLGLKINSTVVNEAGTSQIAQTSAGNNAEDGYFHIEIGPRSANYLHGGVSYYGTNMIATGAFAASSVIGGTAAIPNATITSFAIRGITASASQTLAVKEVAAYEVLYS